MIANIGLAAMYLRVKDTGDRKHSLVKFARLNNNYRCTNLKINWLNQ